RYIARAECPRAALSGSAERHASARPALAGGVASRRAPDDAYPRNTKGRWYLKRCRAAWRYARGSRGGRGGGKILQGFGPRGRLLPAGWAGRLKWRRGRQGTSTDVAKHLSPRPRSQWRKFHALDAVVVPRAFGCRLSAQDGRHTRRLAAELRSLSGTLSS